MRRAAVAVAKRLLVILHRMWIDEADFRQTRNNKEAVLAAWLPRLRRPAPQKLSPQGRWTG
jgi:hypothetical protein